MAESIRDDWRRNDWRELCAAAIKEQDGAKLVRIVDQIIEAIDQTVARSHTLSASPERSPS